MLIMEPCQLTASQAQSQLRSGSLSVTTYAKSLLDRIKQRDAAVQAWAYLDPVFVMSQAQALDKIPAEERGPLHGVAVAIKDVIYTKDMPTQHNSLLYQDHFPKVDAASVALLRQAGALIIGKTNTTEFAAVHTGGPTRNPHDPARTPGGSSSGSAAAVADFQAPLALGTQTGGSTVRPASFVGIFGFKPTWNAVSREGLKTYALMLDTVGVFARCVEDLEMLAAVLDLPADDDDEEKEENGDVTNGVQHVNRDCHPRITRQPFHGLRSARFAVCKTPVWPAAGPGTQAALALAASALRARGAVVEDLHLGPEFARLPEWHATVLHAEGRVSFLPEYRAAAAADRTGAALHRTLAGHVENEAGVTRRQQLEAADGIAALRPRMDEIAGRYDAIITPSVPDVAPLGLESTGSHAFCCMWTALHTPVLNIPGFRGEGGMPMGLSLVAPRLRDRHLLKVGKVVGQVFQAGGGWACHH